MPGGEKSFTRASSLAVSLFFVEMATCRNAVLRRSRDLKSRQRMVERNRGFENYFGQVVGLVVLFIFSWCLVRTLIFETAYAPVRDYLGAGPDAPFYMKFLAGAITGGVGSVIGNPFDVLKVRKNNFASGC